MSRLANWHDSMVLFVNQPLTYVVMRWTRFAGRCCHIPGVGYFVNDPGLARAILARPDCFGPEAPGGLGDFIRQCFGRDVRTPFTLTGEAHLEQRRQLAGLVSGPEMERMLANVLVPECDVIVERLRRPEPVDLAAFTVRAVSRVMAHIVGVRPEMPRYQESLDVILRLGGELSQSFPIRGHGIAPRRLRHLRVVLTRMTDVVRRVTSGPTRSDSVLATVRKLGYSEEDCTALAAVMFLAGTETISSGLPRLIAVLIDSGRWAELQARPECVLSAIDEGFRWTIPSPTVTHGVARDCCVDGVDFRAGRRVNVALRNVLRDARFVEGPNAFRIDRVQPALLKNLWFGGGPHYCLGASLAVAFHRTVLERLLVLPGSPRVVDRRATRGSNFPAYRRLVVEFART